MQLEFNCVSELGEPGPKFKSLFNYYWPEYKSWLESNHLTIIPDLETSIAALEKYMPKMVGTYHQICQLLHADNLAAQFLTGFQPPPYLAACSQAVLCRHDVQLVRNYDFHHSLLEGTFLLSSWHGKKVMATTDSLLGIIDGMNENGLAISLTFGGSKVVGDGFGITFILRYILEFCDTVDEAVESLSKIPSHMAYNVTVVDKTGRFKTVFLSPNSPPRITNNAYTTNHQESIDWLANAQFNKTVERAEYLEALLKEETVNHERLVEAFLQKPLYNNMFSKGFGTLYTVDYRPSKGTTMLRWLEDSVLQSFDHFIEINKTVRYSDAPDEVENNSKNRTTQKTEYWEIVSEYSKNQNKRRKFNYNKK